MRVVVTGAAGFVGSHVCEELLAAGHEVIGVDSFTRFYARELKEANVARCRSHPRFTLLERDVVEGPLPEADAIVHLAGRPGVRCGSPELFTAANVRTTEAVLRSPVRRVVLASSSSVYAPARGPVGEDAPLAPRSPYGRSKLAAERVAVRLARERGIELVRLRYFTVYGPRQRPDMAFHRFIRWALAGEPIQVYGDGEQTRDFTFVDDAVAANVAAGLSPEAGRVFNIGGGSQASVNQVLAIISTLLERPLDVHHLATERGDVRHTAADTRLARELLGFCPRTDLATGLEAEVQWLLGSSA